MIKKQTVDIEHLVEQVSRNGDEEAFKTLFYYLVPKLCNYAAYIVGHRPMAEEIAADVMIKFWTNRKHVEPGPHIKNYFFISAKNMAFNYLRDHNKRQFVSLENPGSKNMIIFENAEDGLMDEELKSVIANTILNLPEKCKLVFQLVKEEQLSYKEVAQLLDISVKTVENQMGKALRRIRTAIDGYRSAGGSNMQILRSLLLFSLV